MDSPTYTASLGVSSFLPAAAPPPGVIPNLVDPISNAWMVRAVMYPLLGISVVLVVLKLYTRKVIIRVTQLDDYFLVTALFFCALSTAASEVHISYGLGLHQWDIKMSVWSPWFVLILAIAQATYICSMLFSKLSLLFFFRSVFTLGRVYTTLWAITLGIVIFYNIPSIILTFFSCLPVQATWDRTRYPEAACLNISVTFIQGIFNAVTDFILLALALPVIWEVQISLHQKIGLGVVFLIGSLTCVVSILRLVIVIYPSGSSSFAAPDFAYSVLFATIWSLVEINCSIICASVVALRPLVRKFKRPENPADFENMVIFQTMKEPLFWK